MEMRNCFLLLSALLLAHPAWSQLPPPQPIMPVTAPPTPPPPKPQTPQEPTSTLNFDFKGFFKYFVEAFGKDALKELLRMTDLKIKAEFPQAAQPVIPTGPPAIPCSTAPFVSGTTVIYSDPLTRSHSSTATYKCTTGYKGVDVVIQCQSGVWSTPAANVSCSIVMCNNPPTVDNAVVQVSDYTYGSQASYTCKPGFHASDIAHPISCRENGQWDPPQFTCANMMANNHAMTAAMNNFGMGMRGMPGMQSMMSGMPGMGGTGGMSGLPAGMEGLMANVAATVMKSQLNNAAGGGQNPMASMGLPPHLMAGQMMGGIGGGAQASLPAHLQGMAPLAPLMDPSLMGTMGLNMPGMTGAAPGGAAAPNRKPLEPEQMQELQTMMMMTSMMRAQRQQQMRQQQMRQQQLRQQQLLRERQRQQQQQQAAQQNQQNTDGTPGLNIGALLTPQQQQQQQQQQGQQQPGAATGTAQMQMLQNALQQMQALAAQMQASGAGEQTQAPAAPSGTGSGTEAAGGGGTQAGASSNVPTSVFGGSQQSGASSSSTPNSGGGESSNPLMSAIMQSALG